MKLIYLSHQTNILFQNTCDCKNETNQLLKISRATQPCNSSPLFLVHHKRVNIHNSVNGASHSTQHNVKAPPRHRTPRVRERKRPTADKESEGYGVSINRCLSRIRGTHSSSFGITRIAANFRRKRGPIALEARR